MRFIGHLDVMRFSRRRCVQSWNWCRLFHRLSTPSPDNELASPLGVGCAAKGEYMDTELRQQKVNQDWDMQASEWGPSSPGIKWSCESSCLNGRQWILGVQQPDIQPTSRILPGFSFLSKVYEWFLAQDSEYIIVTKETKKGHPRWISVRDLWMWVTLWRYSCIYRDASSGV